MLPKVVKQNGAHELFMNAYVVVGQRYYYIDCFSFYTGLYATSMECDVRECHSYGCTNSTSFRVLYRIFFAYRRENIESYIRHHKEGLGLECPFFFVTMKL